MDEEKKSSPKFAVGVIIVLLIVALVAGLFYFRNKDNNNNSSQKDKITLQLKWVAQSQFAGYYTALKKGYYNDENIDLEIKQGGVGINPVDVLTSGGADIAVSWTGNVLPAISKGEDLVNIGQGMQRTGMRMVAKKESGIVNPADIKGKKIGVWAGGNELEPYAFIEKQGFNKDRDVTMVSQNFDMNQLMNGEIDLASAMIYNEYWLPIEQGYPQENLVTFDLEKEGAGMLEDALFVKRDYLNNHKDLLVRFMRATMKGWDYAINHQEEAVDLIGMDFTANDVTARAHQLRSMKEVAKLYAADDGTSQGLFYISRTKLDQTVKIAETYVSDVKDINTDKIYTTDIWSEAVKNVKFSDYTDALK